MTKPEKNKGRKLTNNEARGFDAKDKRRNRNAFCAWYGPGVEATCMESPNPDRVGVVVTYGGEFNITKETKKYFYFFTEGGQETWRVLRSDVIHSPKGQVVMP